MQHHKITIFNGKTIGNHHFMKTMSLKKTHRLQTVMGYLWKSDKSMLNPQGFMVPSDATIETNHMDPNAGSCKG